MDVGRCCTDGQEVSDRLVRMADERSDDDGQSDTRGKMVYSLTQTLTEGRMD